MNVVLAVVVVVSPRWCSSPNPNRGGAAAWIGPGSCSRSHGRPWSSLSSKVPVSDGPTRSWAASLLGSIVVLVGFCLVELHSNDPLLDVRLFRNRSFAIASWIVGMQYLLSTGIGYLLYRVPPSSCGRFSTPHGRTPHGAGGGRGGGRLADRSKGVRTVRRRAITTAGMTFATIALVVINLTQTDSSVFFICGRVVRRSGGIVLMTPGTTSLGLNAVPR